IIYKYVQKGTLLSDLAKFVVGSESYSLKQYELIYNKDGKEQKLNLEKIFVTFAIDDPRRGVISLSRNRELHEIYRAYVTNKNKSEEQDYCDISGERTYCSIRHKGVTGKAKLISSNNPKKFFGRLVSGDEIFHLGSESSEKIHNMLKYLLDNSAYHYYLGENSNCIIWK
uniref:type I-C CRISPR-associated protein Cas8c/Csd1 n=1 Tax=uncultured Veillonella sp. TaxID=159268 RepID=UPI002639B260